MFGMLRRPELWIVLLIVPITVLLSGCAGGPGPWSFPSLVANSGPGVPLAPSADDDEESAEADDEPAFAGTLLLYLPNRIFDLAEIVRFGVNAGFGLGADLRATWVAQAVFIHDTSVGAGFQGLRHLPVCVRVAHSAMGVGPIKTPSLGLLDWPINDYDIRAEFFVAIVGAHVAVDLGAIGDFVAGLFFFDPSEDDFVFGG